MESRAAFLQTTASDLVNAMRWEGFNDIQNCIRRWRYGNWALFDGMATRHKTIRKKLGQFKLSSFCVSVQTGVAFYSNN